MEAFFVGNVPENQDKTHALIVLILNIVIPGLGTFLAGCCFIKQANNNVMIWGVLQFVTLIILVGWVWSIWWGVIYFQKRDKGESSEQPPKQQHDEETQHLDDSAHKDKEVKQL
jgi:hypothetical protein